MKTTMTFGAATFTVNADKYFSGPTASVFLFDKGRVVFEDASGNRARTLKKFRDEAHFKKFFLGEVSR